MMIYMHLLPSFFLFFFWWYSLPLVTILPIMYETWTIFSLSIRVGCQFLLLNVLDFFFRLLPSSTFTFCILFACCLFTSYRLWACFLLVLHLFNNNINSSSWYLACVVWVFFFFFFSHLFGCWPELMFILFILPHPWLWRLLAGQFCSVLFGCSCTPIYVNF